MSLPSDKLTAAIIRALRPLAKILLHCGIGYAEFDSIARTVFVETATREFGLRGRPANASRVASIVGLSRKEVSRIREIGFSIAWNPEMQRSPINNVVHYWLYDKDFCQSPGVPKQLLYTGSRSFSALVQKYVGDLPVGAVRRELILRGAMTMDEFGRCNLSPGFFHISDDRDDLVQNIFFSIRNLLETVEFNLEKHTVPSNRSAARSNHQARFERNVWTTKLTSDEAAAFRAWLAVNGQEFLESANRFIGEREHHDSGSLDEHTVLGVGLYYYEQDPNNE